jgi:hypothetical protein
MRKSEGATIGAVLLAGLLLRPFGSNSPQQVAPSNPSPSSGSASQTGEPVSQGPWIASCNYWAAARDAKADEQASAVKANSAVSGSLHGHFTVNQKSHDFDLGLDASPEDKEQACGTVIGKRWGFPEFGPQDDRNAPQGHVTAIIATVPDPAHTHMAMQFDRRIDAILQAASDNEYVSSYYWLPWKNRVVTVKAEDSFGDAEPGHDPERERQPGLIVLKHVPNTNARNHRTDSAQEAYAQVIYLFLVAESPTLGVDGFQLRNAFRYENEMETELRSKFTPHPLTFSAGKSGHIAIIGPVYTGSAGSFRAGLDEAVTSRTLPSGQVFDIAAETSTQLALNTLSSPGAKAGSAKLNYLSFALNTKYDQNSFLLSLKLSGVDLSSVAFLVEDNTASGSEKTNDWLPKQSSPNDDQSKPCQPTDLLCSSQPMIIRFPREISLLRNARAASDQSDPESGSNPSPYLHLSLRDLSAADNVKQFSRDHTPLSQESVLMEIARKLQKGRIRYISISATNVLDGMFLTQFLRRARPDARLVFFSSDLLMDREIDNVPFVGTIGITPHPLFTVGRPSQLDRTKDSLPYPAGSRSPSDTNSVEDYNSASYTFWRLSAEIGIDKLPQPYLSNYANIFDPASSYPPLWVTVIGTDGNYPLAVLSPCASNSAQILPTFKPRIDPMDLNSRSGNAAAKPSDDNAGYQENSACAVYYETYDVSHREDAVRGKLKLARIYPSQVWWVLCALISLLSVFHSVILGVANYQYLFTRDLAVDENDQPRRRCMTLHVGAVMLFSMAFFVAWPLLSLSFLANIYVVDKIIAWGTLGLGLASVLITFWKTRHYIGWAKAGGTSSRNPSRLERLYQRMKDNKFLFIDVLVWIALLVLPGLCYYLCSDALVGTRQVPYSLVGVSFAFRCIYPESGVSPVVPFLLLLFAWYLWALFQIRRLRFSKAGRPQIPRRFGDEDKDRFFVADEDLGGDPNLRGFHLYENIFCLLITRTTVRRFLKLTRLGKLPEPVADGALALVYAVLLAYFSVFTPIKSLASFLWPHKYFASPGEMLIGVLFFPLMAVALAGWLRIILVWSSLKNGLLDRLENQPIRFAFDRLEEMGWMTMLRQDGLHRQLRDQARSVESMDQMLNENDLKSHLKEKEARLRELGDLRKRLLQSTAKLGSNSHGSGEHPYIAVQNAELDFAKFARGLLDHLLIPYWKTERVGLVESKEQKELPIKALRSESQRASLRLPLQLHAGAASADPPYIQVAEEFLAIRYLSLIRAVLAHLGSLMTFVSASFVLTIVAWNSYPFQPREWVNWTLTGVLAILGAGIIFVFAQMHRDPILSRVTETNANELGLDFYIRVITFGAVPVLTWLAYQFPDIGNVIFRFIQPGLEVVK